MSIFPTRYSTLSANALNDHISKHYGLNTLNCRLLIRNVSDTYLLEGAEKYIFKIYRDAHRSLDQIQGEVALLNQLKAAGAKVAFPIYDLNGAQIQQFQAAEGIRNGVLFSFAKGNVVMDMNEEQLKAVGKEIAFIHHQTAAIQLNNYRDKYDITSTIINPLLTLEPHFSEMREEFVWLKETAEKVIRKLNNFDTASFNYGYCHYDFLPKNFHFDENNNVTFFDFDFAGKGFLVNDLMTLAMHFFFHTEAKRITAKQAELDFKTIIDAYRTVRELSDQEIEAIPYLGFMFWIFFMEFHYLNFEDWSNTFLTPGYTRHRVQLLKKWMAGHIA